MGVLPGQSFEFGQGFARSFCGFARRFSRFLVHAARVIAMESTSRAVEGEGQSSPEGAIKAGSKKMLIVFEGEGTLWNKSKVGLTEDDGDSVTRGKQVARLRPGCRDLLKKLFELNCAVAIWTTQTKRSAQPWLEAIFGEISAKFEFKWYREDCYIVERDDLAVKDTLQVIAAYPDYGFDRTLFVDHNFVSSATSCPGNTLLVPEYDYRDDVFLDEWVFELVKLMLDHLGGEGTIPEFFFGTRRPRATAYVVGVMERDELPISVVRKHYFDVCNHLSARNESSEEIKQKQSKILDTLRPD